MKIICIGRNYAAHARELNNPIPDVAPLIFLKPSSALLVNRKPFFYPEFSDDVHYEAEIVLKICKNGKYIEREFAARYFNEIALGIDFTARDIQSKLKEAGHPWEIAKGFDGSAVLGPFFSLEELDPSAIHFELHKNGKMVQEGYTRLMIFSFEEIIAYASKFFRLQMGDLIFTGTPAGVGRIAIGDRLEGFIEGRPALHCDIR